MRETLLRLSPLLALPYLLWKTIQRPAFRRSIPERLGRGAWDSLDGSDGEIIWLHGASVGEVGGVIPLLQALKVQRPEARFLVTTTSETGKAEVERRVPDVAVALLPLDVPSVVQRVLNKMNPRIVLIAETELWPNFLFELRRRSVPVVIFNGRISDVSFPRYSRLKFLFRPLLERVSRILVQTHLDKERFVALGARREDVTVSGSTKYDGAGRQEIGEGELNLIASDFGISRDALCFVAGSVRPGEEEIVIEVYNNLKKRFPGLQCILAPRHFERVQPIVQMLEKRQIPYFRRSQGKGRGEGLLLLDTHGELRNGYALASVAFVGGSLVDIGGHNPLEPAAFAVPVLFGPYDRNVRDAVSQLKQAAGVVQVKSQIELEQAAERILQDAVLRQHMGEAARRVAEQNSRALETVLPICLQFLPSIPRTSSGESVESVNSII